MSKWYYIYVIRDKIDDRFIGLFKIDRDDDKQINEMKKIEKWYTPYKIERLVFTVILDIYVDQFIEEAYDFLEKYEYAETVVKENYRDEYPYELKVINETVYHS